MREAKYLEAAEQYLRSRDIGFLSPGKIGRKEAGRWEVIFPVPETIDPNVAVVDPPDVRVWVNSAAYHVEIIHQM